MFKKPFKSKNQIQLKSSEKKRLGTELKLAFPSLTEEDLAYFNNSENIIKMKLVTFTEENVDVYIVEKVPMFFDIEEPRIKIPTVYMCWQFPHVVYTFTTYKPVLDKLKNGADLFMPGISTNTLIYKKNTFEANKAAGVNTDLNAAVGATGVCLRSKSEVIIPDSGGKIVKVWHTVGDFLCKVHTISMPQLGAPLTEDPKDESREVDDNNSELPPDSTEKEDELKISTERDVNGSENPPDCSHDSQGSEKEKMNELMEYCFLKAVKYSPKTIYPILPATFFASYMLTVLPSGESINIKKTKWKKFSTFLQEKAEEGIIKLEILQKNEFRIAGIQPGHQTLREFVDKYNLEPIAVVVKPTATGQPTVQQVYSVTAATLPFFAKEGLRKGDELTRNDVRNALNEYIKRENLQDPAAKESVILDPVLYSVLKVEKISRGDLVTSLLDKMSLQHKVSTGGEDGNTTVHKGKMPMVEFEIVTRSGNKKVTLISNLEIYGVDLQAFTKELQLKAAASTTITANVPGKKGPQVQVQGNQILQAARLLEEKFGVKDKFMRGLEKAPKSKKK